MNPELQAQIDVHWPAIDTKARELLARPDNTLNPTQAYTAAALLLFHVPTGWSVSPDGQAVNEDPAFGYLDISRLVDLGKTLYHNLLLATIASGLSELLGGLDLSALVSHVADVARALALGLAKLWDGLRAVWNNAIKPAIQFLDRQILRLRDWLRRTFAPVFAFLRHVRDELTALYRRFLRPIFDTIDFVHQLDRLLQVFHIDLLKGLDTTLQALERRLEEPILWLYSKIAEITNVLNIIVTADGFFQRYTLLRSLARNVESEFNMLVNSRSNPVNGEQRYKIARATVVRTVPEVTADLGKWFAGEPSDIGDQVEVWSAPWAAYLAMEPDVRA